MCIRDRLGVTDFSLARATMEKVFLRIAGGEEGLAQSRLGRESGEMLQAEADDAAQRELDAVVFSEATCCGCNKYAWKATCIYHFCGSGIMVKGTMRCIGTPQELKERYAAGYEISCRLETRDDAHVADLVAFAREAFSSPDVDVAAADADIATLELAGVDPRRTPALAFRAFDDDACARLGVTDFSLARATMEKVFLRIAGGEEGPVSYTHLRAHET